MAKRQIGQVNRLSTIYSFDPKDIDFVDVDLDDDLVLYVDPLLMWRSPHREHHVAHAKIINFFTESIALVKAGKLTEAKKRFKFHEPENLLGVSSKGHQGHGMGDVLGQRVFNGIVNNKDIMDNGLEFINELQMVIADVGPDLISDMAVGIAKSYFINYTQSNCKLLGIPLEKTNTDFFIDSEGEWDEISTELPKIPGTDKFFLLTPKILVRKTDVALNYKDVYKEHLRDIFRLRVENRLSGISRKPKLNWKDVEDEYPATKATVMDTIAETPILRKQIADSVIRDIQSRGLEITSENFKNINPAGQISSEALKEISLSLKKDLALKREIETVLAAHPGQPLLLIDDVNSIIQRAGNDLVVILGSYKEEQGDPFDEVKKYLTEEDYETCIIKDMPDIHHVNPRQKLLPYAALSRFLIVLDFGPSGHLTEIELLKDLTKPVIIISQDKKGSSYMTNGLDFTHTFFGRFTLEKYGTIEKCASEGISWANNMISALQSRNMQQLPWLEK